MILRLRLLLSLLLVINAAAAAAAAPEAPAAGDAAAEQGRSVSFDVWEFRVRGRSVLPRTLVERAVYPFLGPDRSVQDVEAARAALETLFRDQGYPTVIVNIPEQDVSDGVVALDIVQGRVERLRISGATYFSLGRIRREVPALAEGEVPNLPRVQEQLQNLNQANADRRITPVFRPGRRPGTVEVELKVKDELPLHGSVEVNGRNTADTSRTRLTGNLRYDNLWQRMHSLSLQYQVSPEEPEEVQVFAATYVVPVGSGQDRLALYAINSESDTEISGTGALAVVGNGTIVGARWVRPLDGSPGYSHSLTLGGDYKDFDEAIELVGADSLDTPIDYTKFSAQYSGNLIGEQALTRFSTGVNFGVRGLGNDEDEFEDKRFQARPNFVYLTASLNHEREFAGGLRLRGRLEGQVAGQPLISNEQFSTGGADGVRGYFESQALADDGLAGSLELYSPSLARHLHAQIDDLRFLVFADAARLQINDPLPGTDDRIELYGVGAGLRLSAFRHVNASLDLAWPLIDAEDVDKGDSRAHFSVNYDF